MICSTCNKELKKYAIPQKINDTIIYFCNYKCIRKYKNGVEL